ncbi:hypothetical protein EVG20_g7403, partial [Dentipellis fragilis]
MHAQIPESTARRTPADRKVSDYAVSTDLIQRAAYYAPTEFQCLEPPGLWTANYHFVAQALEAVETLPRVLIDKPKRGHYVLRHTGRDFYHNPRRHCASLKLLVSLSSSSSAGPATFSNSRPVPPPAPPDPDAVNELIYSYMATSTFNVSTLADTIQQQDGLVFSGEQRWLYHTEGRRRHTNMSERNEGEGDTLLQDCVQAVLDVSKRADIRNDLAAYARYAYFIRVCNTALESLDIPNLKNPDNLQLLFHCTDPKILAGSYDNLEPVHKPDVVIISLVATRRTSKHLDATWDKVIEKYAPKSLTHGYEWRDILDSRELQRVETKLAPLPARYKTALAKVADLHPAGPQSEVVRGPAKKKRRTETSPGSRCAVRESTMTATEQSGRCAARESTGTKRKRIDDDTDDSEVRLKSTVQCARYGAEMVSRAGAVNHAINLLVIDDVAWYNRQAAIQAEGINFIQDLRRFFVLLAAFQRFTLEGWGSNIALNPQAKHKHDSSRGRSDIRSALRTGALRMDRLAMESVTVRPAKPRISRVPAVCRLYPITTLIGREFLEAWLECVQCNYALWERGVPHSSPSLDKLMVERRTTADGRTTHSGVMSDWDLAHVEGHSQDKRRHRTGTLLFMALELLRDEYWDGKIECSYRHGLEALIWMLPWVFFRFQDGQEIKGAPLGGWRTGNYNVCREKKGAFLYDFHEGIYNPTTSYKEEWGFAYGLLFWLMDQRYASADAYRNPQRLGSKEGKAKPSKPSDTYGIFWRQVEGICSAPRREHLHYLHELIPDACLSPHHTRVAIRVVRLRTSESSTVPYRHTPLPTPYTPQEMSQAHFAHPGDLPYAPPVLRAASPSGSINTEYGPDETSLSDMELSPGEFEGKIEAALRLHEQREQEVVAEAKPVLIPKPKTAAEEKQTFEQVMRCLRWHVQQLEENQIVENMMLRGSQAGLVAQPSSDDVGVIMASMMGSGGAPSRTSVGGDIG